MKNLFLCLAFMLIGTFAFANNNSNLKDNFKNEKTNEMKTNENKSKAALDCANKGGVCLVTIYTNGVPRSFERCCNDIVVVKRPSISAAE